MTCEELRDLYELYALGVLDAEDRRVAEEHLATGCLECAAALGHALAINAAVLRTVPEVEPPPDLRRKLEAGLAGPVRRGFFARYGWALATVIVLLLAIFVTAQQRIRNKSLQAALEFASQPGVRHTVFGPVMNGVHGSVFVQPQRGVLLTVSGLQPPPPGKTYELWIVPKTGAPQAAGPFRTNIEGYGTEITTRPFDPASTAAVAISLEPADSPMDKPTEVLFAAPLN